MFLGVRRGKRSCVAAAGVLAASGDSVSKPDMPDISLAEDLLRALPLWSLMGVLLEFATEERLEMAVKGRSKGRATLAILWPSDVIGRELITGVWQPIAGKDLRLEDKVGSA